MPWFKPLVCGGMSCYSTVENNTQHWFCSPAVPRMGFLLPHLPPCGARNWWPNASNEDCINPVRSTSPSCGRRCWTLLTRASSPCHLGAWSRTYTFSACAQMCNCTSFFGHAQVFFLVCQNRSGKPSKWST